MKPNSLIGAIFHAGKSATESYTYYVLRADADAVTQLRSGRRILAGVVMDFGAVKVHLSEEEWARRAAREGHKIGNGALFVQCADCGHIRKHEEGHDCPDGAAGTYDAGGWT